MKFPVKVFDNETLICLNNADELKDFAKDYRLIYAAGGIVTNENEEVLMIFRDGKWDFPKGKVELGENTETAAIREVREETGLQEVQADHLASHTYHTYMIQGKKILKKTSWYAMTSASDCPLLPQEEENITEACWIPKEKVVECLENSYLSLQNLWQEIMAQDNKMPESR